MLKQRHMEMGLFPAAPSLLPFHQCQAHGGREALLVPPCATVISCSWEAVRMAPPRQSSVFPVVNPGIHPRLPAAGWLLLGVAESLSTQCPVPEPLQGLGRGCLQFVPPQPVWVMALQSCGS